MALQAFGRCQIVPFGDSITCAGSICPNSIMVKVKKGSPITYIAPQTAAAVALCVTDRVGVQPIGRGVSPRPRTLTSYQTAICSPGMSFNGLHPHNTFNYMDYYSFTDPKGMEG